MKYLIKIGSPLLLLVVAGCGLTPPSGVPYYQKQCEIPQDQSNTISGHWLSHPIPIAFHEGDFSDADLQAMTKAADTWNQFFKISKNAEIFDYGQKQSGIRTITSKPDTEGLCARSIIQGNGFVGQVGVYNLNPWPAEFQKNAIAITKYCPAPVAQGYPRFYAANIFLNTQDYFSEGKKQPDRISILTHELGHLLGLDHSCSGSNQAGVPNCSSPQINVLYLQASMFPNFSFDGQGNGEQRRKLNYNDQTRANCLY